MLYALVCATPPCHADSIWSNGGTPLVVTPCQHMSHCHCKLGCNCRISSHCQPCLSPLRTSQCDLSVCRKLNEIVADKQREVILRFSNKEVVQLSLCMDMLEAVDKLAHLASSGKLPSQRQTCTLPSLICKLADITTMSHETHDSQRHHGCNINFVLIQG